jgi:sorting nexin-25
LLIIEDIVEVQREGGEQLPAAQWAVARRYSEFFQLHQQLKRFEAVRDLEFPRRRVVMKLQKDFLEKRRVALEKYLQVCSSIKTLQSPPLTPISHY